MRGKPIPARRGPGRQPAQHAERGLSRLRHGGAVRRLHLWRPRGQHRPRAAGGLCHRLLVGAGRPEGARPGGGRGGGAGAHRRACRAHPACHAGSGRGEDGSGELSGAIEISRLTFQYQPTRRASSTTCPSPSGRASSWPSSARRAPANRRCSGFCWGSSSPPPASCSMTGGPRRPRHSGRAPPVRRRAPGRQAHAGHADGQHPRFGQPSRPRCRLGGGAARRAGGGHPAHAHGVAHRHHRWRTGLSGGQIQRVLLARAIVSKRAS